MARPAVHEVGSPLVAVGDRVEDLDTPLILADLDRMERNIRDWQSWMDGLGVRFRVHIKTHKVPEIALLQLAAGARGICCAKISEAEPFAAVGIDDIAIAYPVFGEQKWARVAEMAGGGVRMTANCDSEAARPPGLRRRVGGGARSDLQIDVDSGMHRGGIPRWTMSTASKAWREPSGASRASTSTGSTTHRSYFFEGKRSREEEGHTEGQLLVDIADELRSRGLEVREVTAGGSFTGKYVAEVPGITESRAGHLRLLRRDARERGLHRAGPARAHGAVPRDADVGRRADDRRRLEDVLRRPGRGRGPATRRAPRPP